MTKESDCLPCSGGFYCYKLGAINFDFSLNDTGTGQCAAGYYCKSGSYHPFSRYMKLKVNYATNGQAVVKIIHEESLKHMFLMESEIKFHIVLFREFAVISILMVDIYYCRCKRQHPHSCHHQWNRRSLSPRLLLPTADRGPHPLPQWNLQGYIPGGQEG